MPAPHHPAAAVRRVLRKLGTDIHDARRRRRLPIAVVAERAFTSRTTLQRIEERDASVGIGIYAAVLQALGLLEGLDQVTDISQDSVGQALATAELPARASAPSLRKALRCLTSRFTSTSKVKPGALACFVGTRSAERRRSPSNMTVPGSMVPTAFQLSLPSP